MSETLLVFPDTPPPDLVRSLDLAGYRWTAVSTLDEVGRNEPEDGWSGAIVVADTDAPGAWSLCRDLRKRDVPIEPLLLLISGSQIDDLEAKNELFDDFLITPFHPRELEARLKHLLWGVGRGVGGGG